MLDEQHRQLARQARDGGEQGGDGDRLPVHGKGCDIAQRRANPTEHDAAEEEGSCRAARRNAVFGEPFGDVGLLGYRKAEFIVRELKFLRQAFLSLRTAACAGLNLREAETLSAGLRLGPEVSHNHAGAAAKQGRAGKAGKNEVIDVLHVRFPSAR